MLIPYGPGGLIILTDRYGKRVAVIDPVSRRVVHMAGGRSPLVAPGLSGRLAVPTGVVAVPFGDLDLLNPFSGVFPDQGPYTGGTVVTLIGHHFTGATDVRFGLRPAAGFAVLDDATIMAVTPAGTGAVPVTVTTPGGTARIGYFFYVHWPTLRTILPAAGPIRGGNIVELGGVNLFTALLVNFGVATAHPTAVSDQQLLVAAPPAVGPGTVPVWVTTTGGISNQLFYTYVAVPTVTGVSPQTGPIAGGTTVLVTGTALSRVTAVTVGGVPAASFRAFSDTLLVVVTPPGTAGPADLTITTPGGTVTVPGAFGYQASTETTVTSAPDPSVVGQPVTFTATVTPVPPGADTPTGTVTFDFGDGTGPTTVPLSGGVATVSHAYAATSGTPYPITATYNGNPDYASSSGTDTQTVNKAATTTAVVSSPDPLGSRAVGDHHRHGRGRRPRGRDPDRHGHLHLRRRHDRRHRDAVRRHRHRHPHLHHQDRQPLRRHRHLQRRHQLHHLQRHRHPDPQQEHDHHHGDIDPRPVGGRPVGDHQRDRLLRLRHADRDGHLRLRRRDQFCRGHAVRRRRHRHPHLHHDHGGPFTITATYGGDNSYAGSSDTDTQTLSRAATTTTVVSTPNPSTTGDPVTVTATVAPVAPGTGTPTGTVTLAIPGRTPQTVTLVNGTASGTFNPLAKGTYTVTANYNGSVGYAASAGTTTQTVTPGQA